MSNYQLFEKYLSEVLSDSEKQDIENRLDSDPDFHQDFVEHVKMQKAMDILLEEELAKVVDGIKSDDGKGSSKNFTISDIRKQNKSLRWLQIAASLLILVCSVYFVRKIQPQKDVFAAHYRSTIDTSLRANGDVQTTEFDIKYAKAKTFLDKGHREEKDFKEAIRIFQTLLPTAEGLNKEHLEYHIALCYINFDKTKSRELFTNIANNKTHWYHDKAIEILEDLQ